MLPGMAPQLARALLPAGPWSLPLARAAASIVIDHPAHAPALVQALFSPDANLRSHAADVARRITEKHPNLLQPYAERVLGALAHAQNGQGAQDDWRMLAHSALVAARLARTRPQRLRAAGLLRPCSSTPATSSAAPRSKA
jgi:hypothetical protein